MDRIHFPAPIITSVKSMAEKPKTSPSTPNGMGTNSAHYAALMEQYAHKRMMCMRNHFDVGAVVCKRFSTLEAIKNPYNWGIVTSLLRYESDPAKYKPIIVRWFMQAAPSTGHDMDELYLLHGSIRDEELRLIIQAQDDAREYGDAQC